MIELTAEQIEINHKYVSEHTALMSNLARLHRWALAQAERLEASPATWGRIGDLEYINDKLHELVVFARA